MTGLKTSIDVNGEVYAVSVGYSPYIFEGGLSVSGEVYVRSLISAREVATRLASNELLATYNENWTDETHRPLNIDQFVKSLRLRRIIILDTPESATLYFDDGDLFGGHMIAVSFAGKTPMKATLEG